MLFFLTTNMAAVSSPANQQYSSWVTDVARGPMNTWFDFERAGSNINGKE